VPRPRVLVIDDDPTLLALVGELLAERFAVATRDTCEGAFEAILDAPPDAVLADCLFGRRPAGWDLARRLREDPRTAGVGVVLFTVHGAFVRDNAAELGRLGIAVAAKPFDLDALLDAVAAAIPDDPAAAPKRPEGPGSGRGAGDSGG
jgi:DNA-binding response OmpR family regulator